MKDDNEKDNNNNVVDIDNYLSSVYYDASSPGSFSGLEKIWSHVKQDPEKPKKLSKKLLRDWLNTQETYQVYKAPKRKFQTEAIITDHIGELLETDLLIMRSDKPKINRNMRYLLAAIDVFSRKVYVRLLSKKTAQETATAFKSILAEGVKCESLRSDSGSEFIGHPFQEMLKEANIYHFKAYGSVKCGYIERFFRTFQTRYYRYAYKNNTSNFVDIVQQIVQSYNNTKHSVTGFKPNEVNSDNSLTLYDRVYTPILLKRAKEKLKSPFKVGDLVRISLSKEHFKKHSYTVSWSEEVFEVFFIITSHPLRFKLRDLKQEGISGSFYQQELKLANAKNSDEINWKIERIISRRRVGGVNKSLIKWWGFPNKFNTWIKNSDLKKYPQLK